jgi:DeoR family transcriptional regulator, aga operon transcriptional repressor
MEELPAARRERLAALVAADGFVRVADAAARLGVSEVTVRHDLGRLESDGRLRRVHGGAMAPRGERREARVEATARRDAATKRAIGRAAADLVPDGASILLDVGSTCLAVAEALVARDDLTELVVVTNGLGIALALEPAIPRFTVVVTGGTLRPLQHSLVDPIASRTLAELHVDLAIIGCNGVADDGTVTNVNLPEAEVKAAMLASAGTAALVADGSKVGQRHLGRIGGLADFTTMVTDASGADRLRRAAHGSGCRVVVAHQ